MKHIVVGMLAHVDAGKTTLTEHLLYQTGAIRQMGRVDKKDTLLDYDAVERERGITIYLKEARMRLEDLEITLVDTPGHADLLAETQLALKALDYAILIISGTDGVQPNTKMLWNLLATYQIPTLIFVNKMDQVGADEEGIIKQLKSLCSDGCIKALGEDFQEEAATLREDALEEYLAKGMLSDEILLDLFRTRKLFPCYFGSALHSDGMEDFLKGIQKYLIEPARKQDNQAIVYKITRDGQGRRLTHLKVEGGSLTPKMTFEREDGKKVKIDQIFSFFGEKKEPMDEALAGQLCAVTGLEESYVGQGLGREDVRRQDATTPVISKQILFEQGTVMLQVYPMLQQLSEEMPQLKLEWKEEVGEVHVRLLGKVQEEILARLMKDRFGYQVSFGPGKIIYKESITRTTEGVGHFEPLRHYAEVHLLIEPAQRGSGVEVTSQCPEDLLGKNWQKMVLATLQQPQIGVLTGSVLTDVKITLMSGKSHIKHSDPGDFRQAARRALRQGLMKNDCILLEPIYEFEYVLPSEFVGKAMTDLEKMGAKIEPLQLVEGQGILKGTVPVAAFADYDQEVLSYTKGQGRIICTLAGYEKCQKQIELIAAADYHPDLDVDHPTGSIFCHGGSGDYVPWDQVEDKMHLPSVLSQQEEPLEWNLKQDNTPKKKQLDAYAAEKELEEIFQKTFGTTMKRRGEEYKPPRVIRKEEKKKENALPKGRDSLSKRLKKEEYLLVDGYNVIFSWPMLNDLAKDNIHGARMKLMEILSGYQGLRSGRLILVFDAYRVEGHSEEITTYQNIEVVYTKEAQTADQYIEKVAHKLGKTANIRVATSDGLEQIIIRGEGCRLTSSRELMEEITLALEELRGDSLQESPEGKVYLLDHMNEEDRKELEKIRLGHKS